jgi:membrane glycosyltransferase
LGALTGLKLEWTSPPRAAEAPQWSDVTRRLAGPILLPVATGLALLQRSASVALAPIRLPLSFAIPLVVLTGHPRVGRLAKQLGLLRTPEEGVRPRPLVQAAQCRGFLDLVPVRASLVAGAPCVRRPRAAMRWAHVGLVATTVALLAMSPRPSGDTHQLPRAWHEGTQLVALDDTSAMPSFEEMVEKPPSRKRVLRERPAQMIDDAVRRRAKEAVQRALAERDAPV